MTIAAGEVVGGINIVVKARFLPSPNRPKRCTMKYCRLFVIVTAAFLGCSHFVNYAGDEAYFNGNFSEAVLEYQKAAAGENADAQYMLANMLLFGQGVKQDVARAEKLLRLSAARGNKDAQLSLGYLYLFSGKHVLESEKEAENWLQKAAPKDGLAQFHLGLIYATEIYGKKDKEAARRFFQESEEMGFPVPGDLFVHD